MDWESEYEARKIRLRQLCETEEFKPEFSVQDSWRNGSSPDVRFVVDENNKVLYCELPKVGCTNWKRTMLQLIQPKTFGKLAFDDIKGPHGHYGEEGYKYITEWPAEERLKMVDTFYKFIFVRHPLERILSAYRDKVQYDFLRNLPFQNPGKVTDHDADEFMDLDKEGFHAFVKYLTKRVDLAAGGSRIRHWKRYVDLCGICSFDWDFVGKLETVNEDSQFVLEDMKVSHLAEYPVKNRTTDHSMIIRYYKGLGRHWLDKLYETYKPDFDLFGYEIPHYLIDIQ